MELGCLKRICLLKWKQAFLCSFSLSDLKHPGKNIWSKPHLWLLSHSQISDRYISRCGCKLSDGLICKVCLPSFATLIIRPAPLNEATVTDNKHIILHVMAVKDLNLHQENGQRDLWWSIWPHPSMILSLADTYVSIDSTSFFNFKSTIFPFGNTFFQNWFRLN